MSIDPRAEFNNSSPSINNKNNTLHLLKVEECSIEIRNKIEAALQDKYARIPAQFKPYFYKFQNIHQRHFLMQINYIGQMVFLIYFFADLMFIPDLAFVSGLIRVGTVFVAMLVCYAMFRACKDIRLLDMLLPIGTIWTTLVWLTLLIFSSSPLVSTYIYCAVIFIILANLCVHVQFKPAMLSSLLISLLVASAVTQLLSLEQSLVFFASYAPIFLFSLYISWNNTLNARHHFLRSLLDDWNFHTLESLAHTDELTKLYNRRQFVHVAEYKIKEWPRYDNTCLMMFDVDHFKKINDSYGHDVGDQVLQLIAEITHKEMRSKDILARFGGEEFIALLTETSLPDALLIAERVRESISHYGERYQLSLNFTVSVGVAQLKVDQDDLNELIKEADLALYQAKQNGRNRVECYDDSMQPLIETPSLAWEALQSTQANKNQDQQGWSIL